VGSHMSAAHDDLWNADEITISLRACSRARRGWVSGLIQQLGCLTRSGLQDAFLAGVERILCRQDSANASFTEACWSE